jgi:hypothetical protein
MSFQFDTLHISHQLTTGIGYPECLGFDKKVIRGSVYLDGPTITGDENTFKTVEGSVMIGPCNNEDSPLPKICDDEVRVATSSNLELTCKPDKDPIVAARGVPLGEPYSLVVRSGDHITRDRSVDCSLDGAGPGPIRRTESNSAALFVGDVDIDGFATVSRNLVVGRDGGFRGKVVIGEDLNVGSDIDLNGTVEAAGDVIAFCGVHVLSNKKDFDIPHPSKEGWRLRHVCIEGPTADVYFRGRIKNQNEISLPSYWKNLVDPLSITVSLTPVGSHQDVIIKRIGEEKIYLQSKGNMPIDCFYHVYGERIDCEKNIPEYQGLTVDDYPGDNSEYNHNNG